MQGIISNFRRGKRKVSDNQMIVIVDGIKKKEDAKKLVGKKVVYNTGKKEMLGKISFPHGNQGAVRVIFSTGMPGQAVGKKVKIE
jgi:ribosomal protein L35AE/L33A